MSVDNVRHIAGFAVVRRPELNRDPAGRGVFPAIAPHVGDLFYSGVDRMPWFDIDEANYSGTLPKDLQALRQALHTANEDFTGIDLCRDLSEAQALLAFSNRHEPANELIAVDSLRLTKIKGEVLVNEAMLEWLGYDVVALGSWSLLREGLFAKPTLFPKATDYTNASGLLRTPNDVMRYVSAYRILSESGSLEALDWSTATIEPLLIARFKGPTW